MTTGAAPWPSSQRTPGTQLVDYTPYLTATWPVPISACMSASACSHWMRRTLASLLTVLLFLFAGSGGASAPASRFITSDITSQFQVRGLSTLGYNPIYVDVNGDGFNDVIMCTSDTTVEHPDPSLTRTRSEA